MKTADELMALDDRPIFDVDVPQWGIVAKVRECDVLQITAISKMATLDDGTRDQAEFAARVIVAGCVDPKFEPRHIEQLKAKSNSATTALFAAIISGKKKEALKS